MSDSAYSGQPDASIDAGLILRAILKRLPHIALITLFLCAIAYAVLMFVPRLYESRAELLVEPRSTAFTSTATNQSADAYYIDAATVASQIELIRARDTIRAVIEALDLREDPAFAGRSDERIIADINDNLVVTQERASRLISIAYRAEDPDLAARIANGFAVTHINRRAGQQISDTLEATAWLEQEINRLRTLVSQAERAIADFRVEHDLFVGSNNESLTSQQLSNFTSQITAAAERRNAAQSRAQLIRALLESGQSVVGVSDVQSSSVGQQLTQELARLQGERAQRAATLLPGHPTIRALDAQIAEIDNQIAIEGRNVAAALDAQARIEADLEQSLQGELDRLKIAASSDAVEGVTLAELEREASAQRELLNAYLLRYTEATARSDMSSALPDVRIVSQAAPAVGPASPRTGLVLFAVGVASILLQVGAAIFSELLSGRALVERREPLVADAEDADEIEIAETVAEPEPELISEPSEAEPLPLIRARKPVSPLAYEIEAIAASAVAGLDRVIVLASAGEAGQSQDFSERLTAKLIADGQSVAEIDAASGQQGIEPGLADLCAGEADFGDVVHRGSDDRFAFVPWGQAARLERDAGRAATLVEALSDIYEVVIVVTGKIGMGSSLPLFASTGAKCVLLAADEDDGEQAEMDVAALGFDPVQIVLTGDRRSEVA